MQFAMNALSVTAGMAFSLGIALAVEELIFGKVLPLLFTKMRQTARIKQNLEAQR